MRAEEGSIKRRALKFQQRRKMTKNDQARAEPDKQTKQQTNRRGVPGWQRRIRGGEGCTNHIRIAIGQLSGVQCRNWSIILMNTSVWPN